ncbi:MAG: His-Xaa-Ser system radical SAM maturase HxsB [Candidatus Aenigmatarchaeota archaeon]
MAISYFDYFGTEDFKINNFSFKKFDDNHVLVTTIHGGWIVLDKREFDLLRFGKLQEDPILFKKLEKEGIILTGNNEQNVVNAFKSRQSFLFSSVNLHIISPTLRCNQRCVYCHAKSKPLDSHGFDMDEETAKATVDFIFQAPVNSMSIEFQGGEPLVNFPIVEYIIEYSKELAKKKKKFVRFIMVTNLTLMDHDILKYLIENKVSLCTSLDGPEKVHNKNRKYFGGSGTYKDVVHWIDVIKKEYKYPLEALPTTTKFSLKYPKEIVDEYVERGFRLIRMRSLNNAGMAHELWKKIGYTPEEYVEFWKNALEHTIELYNKGVNIKENMSVLVTRKFLTRNYPNYTCWGNPCGAALSQCAYDYEGNIYACDEARSFDVFRIGNVKESNYKDVFLSDIVGKIVSASSGLLNGCEGCVWHPFCGFCMVCTFGQQGNIIGNMGIDNECKIRKSILEHILRKIVFSEKDRGILINWALGREGI